VIILGFYFKPNRTPNVGVKEPVAINVSDCKYAEELWIKLDREWERRVREQCGVSPSCSMEDILTLTIGKHTLKYTIDERIDRIEVLDGDGTNIERVGGLTLNSEQ